MPDINKIYQSEFLRAEDLGGQERIATIERAPSEMLGSGDDAVEKVVLYFKGVKKKLRLNKTNVLRLAEAFKEVNSDNWAGRKVKLRPETTMFGPRGMVPCIRTYGVPMPKSPPSAAAPAPAPKAPPASDMGAELAAEQAADLSDSSTLKDDVPWPEE